MRREPPHHVVINATLAPSTDHVITFSNFFQIGNVVGIMLQVAIHGDDVFAGSMIEPRRQRRLCQNCAATSRWPRGYPQPVSRAADGKCHRHCHRPRRPSQSFRPWPPSPRSNGHRACSRLLFVIKGTTMEYFGIVTVDYKTVLPESNSLFEFQKHLAPLVPAPGPCHNGRTCICSTEPRHTPPENTALTPRHHRCTLIFGLA